MNLTRFVLVLFFAATAVPPAVRADSADDWKRMRVIRPKGYVCYRATSPIQVDGRIDESEWGVADWTDDFADIEGDAKPKPRFRTRARMLWDNEYFYIAAHMEEPHVWGTLTKHDSVIFHDNDFEVFIDPNGDNHEYYEFEMNALNTGWDLFLPRPYKDGGKADNGWEIPGLKSAVFVSGSLNDPTDRDQYWSIELAIPWQAMSKFAHTPAPPGEGDQWRVNFSRVEWQHEIEGGMYRKKPGLREDNWVWSPQGIIDMHRPERWGFVQFSTRSPGSVKFQYDESLPAREALMTVYHEQKGYYQRHKQWAPDLKTLKLDSLADTVTFRTTADGFEASVDLNESAGKRLLVRQDSRLILIPHEPAGTDDRN